MSFIFPLIFYFLNAPVQFVVKEESFIVDNIEIKRPVYGLISLYRDSTFFRIDKDYASYHNYRYERTPDAVSAGFHKGKVYGYITANKHYIRVELHQSRYKQVIVTFKVKRSTIR